MHLHICAFCFERYESTPSAAFPASIYVDTYIHPIFIHFISYQIKSYVYTFIYTYICVYAPSHLRRSVSQCTSRLCWVLSPPLSCRYLYISYMSYIAFQIKSNHVTYVYMDLDICAVLSSTLSGAFPRLSM